MSQNQASRRRTDHSPPDPAKLAEVRLARLSRDVGEACNAFLASRGLPVGRVAGWQGQAAIDAARRAGGPVATLP